MRKNEEVQLADLLTATICSKLEKMRRPNGPLALGNSDERTARLHRRISLWPCLLINPPCLIRKYYLLFFSFPWTTLSTQLDTIVVHGAVIKILSTILRCLLVCIMNDEY